MIVMNRNLVAVLLAVPVMAAATARLAPAQTGQQQSRPFTPGTCGRVDPTYIRLAEKTGGQPMFLQPSEMASAGHLMRETTLNNTDALLYATAHLGGQSREYDVPVDSAVRRVTFSLSFDAPGTKLVITRPSGATVASGEGGVEISEWTCGRIVTIGSPEKGNWRVRLSGTGRLWLRVIAPSDLYILNAEFVRLGGRPGHEGYFKISGQPIASRQENLHVTISGALQKAEFSLVSASAELLQPLAMREEGSDPEDHEFFGSLTLPPGPFRVAVKGLDGNGLPFQRMFLTQFQATSLEISAVQRFEEVRAGATITLTFNVRNYGVAASYRLLAVDGHAKIIPTEPAEVALAAGGSAQVKLDVAVPAETRPGTSITVTITATSTTNPEMMNGTVVELSVAGP